MVWVHDTAPSTSVLGNGVEGVCVCVGGDHFQFIGEEVGQNGSSMKGFQHHSFY